MAKETKKPEKKSPPATPAKKAPAKKSAPRLPVLLEVSFTASSLIVLFVGVSVAITSLLAGCPIWLVAVRSGAAILGVGLAFWLINYCLARGTIQANHALREELQAALENEPAQSSIERSA